MVPGTLKTLSNCNSFAISLQGLHCVNNFIQYPSITSLWRKLILKLGPTNLKPSDQQFLFLLIQLCFWTFSPYCSPPQEMKPLPTLLSNPKLRSHSSSPCLLNTISSLLASWLHTQQLTHTQFFFSFCSFFFWFSAFLLAAQCYPINIWFISSFSWEVWLRYLVHGYQISNSWGSPLKRTFKCYLVSF